VKGQGTRIGKLQAARIMKSYLSTRNGGTSMTEGETAQTNKQQNGGEEKVRSTRKIKSRSRGDGDVIPLASGSAKPHKTATVHHDAGT
jgi:hypothetical protein